MVSFLFFFFKLLHRYLWLQSTNYKCSKCANTGLLPLPLDRLLSLSPISVPGLPKSGHMTQPTWPGRLHLPPCTTAGIMGTPVLPQLSWFPLMLLPCWAPHNGPSSSCFQGRVLLRPAEPWPYWPLGICQCSTSKTTSKTALSCSPYDSTLSGAISGVSETGEMSSGLGLPDRLFKRNETINCS